MQFKAFRINKIDDKVSANFQQMQLDELSEGNVVIKVAYSSINYKDAIAATAAGGREILRKYPLNGGIDLAGTVESSQSDDFKPGDRVLANGQSLSETIDGGYSQYARLDASNVMKMPDNMDAYTAMAIGTAGFTAALAYVRMEQNDQTPEMGPIVVTGATGGVGSFAIDLFSSKGYEVVAVTGKQHQHPYLQSLGATEFLNREQTQADKRPLSRATWGGAVDSVGGDTLTWLTQTVKPWGNIGSIGLAGGYKLNTTVMPFILRGVSLLGINSIEMPKAKRQYIWDRLADDLSYQHLDKIVSKVIKFEELPNAFNEFIEATVVGRIVVEING